MGDFIDDFIQEYKKQPSLWQTNHPDFKNRKKRQEAYIKLIEVANKHNEAYNIERTKQKINNLRCAFRVQLKKYNEVKNNSKDGKEETYCPKRKYFESLMFLLNEETSAAKSSEANKIKSSVRRNSEIGSRTRNKTLSRKKIDKELEAITSDLKDDLEDDNFLAQSLDAEKENKSKSDSFEENEEDFNLALIEEEENLSICNTKEIDPDAFESIIEEDEHSNKEIQSDFIKITKTSSPSITTSHLESITQPSKDVQKQKSPLLAKQNHATKLSEENIVLIQSNPTSTSSVTITSSTPTSTTISTRAHFRQVQSKPPQQNNSKLTVQQPNINNRNAKVIQVRSIKTMPNNNLQTLNSASKQSQQPIQNINPQKRLSTGLPTQCSTSSSITMSSISPLTTSKTNIGSPIIAQKVVFPKVTSPTQQQLTIRNAQNQLQTRSTAIPIPGVTLSSLKNNSSDGLLDNSDTMASQIKKIKLDFDSSNLEKILSLACSKLKKEDNDDDFTVFGRMVTCKLKTMDTEQALIAQRLITEILFDGQMKLLQLPHQNSQKNITSNLPQIFTHATPITALRQLNANGQTFYISEMNENNNNMESNPIQFSTNSSGNVGVSNNEC